MLFIQRPHNFAITPCPPLDKNVLTSEQEVEGCHENHEVGPESASGFGPWGADLRMLRGQPSPCDACGHQLHFASKVTVAHMFLIIF